MTRMGYALVALFIGGGLAGGLPAQETRAEREKEQEQKTVVVHTGKITKFERGDPAIVMVKTDKGEINAELAPVTYLEEQKLALAPDEDVTIRGYEMKRDGRTVFVTTEVTSNGRVVKLRSADYEPLWTKVTTTQAPEKATVVTGKIRVFEKTDPARVVIITDKGETTAELAPVTYLEQNKLVFNPNDVVTVSGYQTIRDDRPVFVVTDVTGPDRRVVRLRGADREPLWTRVATVERADAATDLTGTVTVVETTDTPDGRLVTVKTDSGERVIALGPGRYLEEKRYVLKPGERIVVNGWDVDRGGRRVFLAGHVRVGPNNWQFRRPNRTVIWE
jgi:hypothetical protein